MIITIKNNTGNTVFYEINNVQYVLNSNCEVRQETYDNRFQFNCFQNKKSSFKYAPLSKSIIYEYNFVLRSFYVFEVVAEEAIIILEQQIIKGDNLDNYEVVRAFPMNCVMLKEDYYILDESDAKLELFLAHKKEQKSERILKFFSAIQTALYIGIPTAILFFGLLHFCGIKIATVITLALLLLGMVVGLIFKKLINAFTSKIDKKTKTSNNVVNNYEVFFNEDYLLSIITK